MSGRRATTSGRRSGPSASENRVSVLRLDPTACSGVGRCALSAPGLVTLDSWGYPRTPTAPLDAASVAPARRTAQACPRRALFVDSLQS
jgi:ferredoxin